MIDSLAEQGQGGLEAGEASTRTLWQNWKKKATAAADKITRWFISFWHRPPPCALSYNQFHHPQDSYTFSTFKLPTPPPCNFLYIQFSRNIDDKFDCAYLEWWPQFLEPEVHGRSLAQLDFPGLFPSWCTCNLFLHWVNLAFTPRFIVEPLIGGGFTATSPRSMSHHIAFARVHDKCVGHETQPSI